MMVKEIKNSDIIVNNKYGVIKPLDTVGVNDDDIHDPSVVYDGTIYHMWYGGIDDDVSKIYYSTSTDGIKWVKHDTIVLLETNGKLDDEQIYYPSVIKDGVTYKMWYTGSDGTHYRIHYATSTDGKTWIKHGVVSSLGTISDNDDYIDIYTPSVLLDNVTYHIWYGGHDGSSYIIHYATSTDGIKWVKQDTVVLTGSTGGSDDYGIKSPSVIYDGTRYIMFYTGRNSNNEKIHYATSTDGIHFYKHGVVSSLGISDEDINESSPYVIHDGNIYKMWYVGFDGENTSINYTELLDLCLL